MATVICLEGEKGTGKSSFPLTIPGKLAIIDLEFGADRATKRLGGDVKVESEGEWTVIRHKKYTIFRIEPNIEKMFLVKGDLVSGQMEKWQMISNKFIDLIRDSEHSTISFDTHKECWIINHRAELQRMQQEAINAQRGIPGFDKYTVEQLIKAAGDSFRKNLMPWEYSTPNSQMNAMIDMAKATSFDKNLCMVNHVRDIYVTTIQNGQSIAVPSGQKELDGWKQCVDRTDWELYTTVTPPVIDNVTKLVTTTTKFHAQIRKSPVGANIVGMTIDAPSWDALEKLAKVFGGNGDSIDS